MAWFNLFNRPPTLEVDQAWRLQHWRALPMPELERELDEIRMVVLDVETSGFSLRRDQLIAIGASTIVNGRVILKESFEIILKQASISSKENILIHGIGKSAQENGLEPVEALLRFLEYIRKDVLIAFHVGFDLPMIDKALKKYLGVSIANHIWLDAAFVAPIIYPDYARSHRSLDHWTELFEIRNMSRHNAAADALATAELMLKLLRETPANINLKKLYQLQQKAMRVHRELHGSMGI